MFGLSKQIIGFQKPDAIVLAPLISLGIENDISVQLRQRGNEVIYALVDKPPSVSEFETELNFTDRYTFLFAVHYNWSLRKVSREFLSAPPKSAFKF